MDVSSYLAEETPIQPFLLLPEFLMTNKVSGVAKNAAVDLKRKAQEVIDSRAGGKAVVSA
jgi:hypothetical protein